MTTVDYSELWDAVDAASSTDLLEAEGYIDKKTGKVFIISDMGAFGEEEIPDDIRESSRYLLVPTKKDLGLAKPLVMAFVREALPNDYDTVAHYFRTKGAWLKFRTLLQIRGDALDRWYRYEERAIEVALTQWVESRGLVLRKNPRSAN